MASAAPQRSSILVIGSAGFIGSHLTSKLAELGHYVVGFDQHAPTEPFGTRQFIQGDIRQAEDIQRAITESAEPIDTVINLAAIHFDFGHEPDEYFETNEGGMQVLLNVMGQNNIKRLLFTSSIAVYGDRSDSADEQTAPTPTSPYGASKLAAEKQIEQWVAAHPDFNITIMRPCAVYGERNISNMMNLIRQIYSGFFVLFGAGDNVKATAYVGNLVDAMISRLDQLSPGIQVYNYADKPDLTVREIVGIIRSELGRNPKPLWCPLWLGVLAALPFEAAAKLTGRNFPVSIARVKKLAQPTQVEAQRIRGAGFQQAVSSAEGLRRMVRHFLAGRSQN
ncbi:MAG: NAD(P)-dependent oxidoreductase [Planctomycetales bacterium]|nr:NAD(P)-dependent oxidoreductase [Planctomycetales bacterium]